MSGSATRIRRATDPHRSASGGRMARRIVPLLDRLMRHIEPEPNTGCWLWTGAAVRTGYGVIALGRSAEGIDVAHRVAWRLFRGDIPPGIDVLHKCDVPACCNPDHLFLGDDQANREDMARKGRGRKSLSGLPLGVRVNANSAGGFQAHVTRHGKYIHLGRFDTVEQASAAVAAHREMFYGEGTRK